MYDGYRGCMIVASGGKLKFQSPFEFTPTLQNSLLNFMAYLKPLCTFQQNKSYSESCYFLKYWEGIVGGSLAFFSRVSLNAFT